MSGVPLVVTQSSYETLSDRVLFTYMIAGGSEENIPVKHLKHSVLRKYVVNGF